MVCNARYMTASSNWESWSGESGNLLWRSGTVSWASLTLNWLSPARARHPRWHSPSLSVFPTFCWMWDTVTKGKSCRNQHILIQLSPPSMSLTTLPQPNRDLFSTDVVDDPTWLIQLGPHEVAGPQRFTLKTRGNLSSWIWENGTCHNDLLFQETHGADNQRLGLTSCIWEWSPVSTSKWNWRYLYQIMKYTPGWRS